MNRICYNFPVPKLIIFDWDDVFTLGATNGYFASYHAALQEVGVNLPPLEEQKRIKAKWGRTVEEELGELLKEKPDLINDAVEKYEKILMGDTFVNCLTLIEGSIELITELSKNYKLAIASGVNPRILKQKIFTKFSIPDVFSEIITVYDLDDPEKAKPHPFIVEEIMKRQGVKPNETIVVGDAQNDVKMAQAAGTTPVVVLTGHLNRAQAEEMGVKYIIDKVTDLPKVLEKMS